MRNDDDGDGDETQRRLPTHLFCTEKGPVPGPHPHLALSPPFGGACSYQSRWGGVCPPL